VFLAILDEAKQQDLKVAAHLPESIYIEDAAAAGLDSSEHFNGFEKVIARLLDEPLRLTYAGQGSEAHYLRRIAEVSPEELETVYQGIRQSGMTVCPTVVTFKTLTHISDFQDGDFPNQEYVSPALADMWKQLWGRQQDLPEFIWQNWIQMVTGLNRAGVPLMTGTDLMLPGILPGFSLHEEMAIWQEAGIPPADILRSATLVPVQFMGLEDRLGTIDEGKMASVVLVRGDPLEDIRNTQRVESVFLRGEYFSRADLDHLLAEAREAAQVPNP
jgi:imidazolonepropionase-like amidohydrolase